MERRELAVEIAQRYAALDGVVAVALSGSAAGAHSDQHSDVDLYVYAAPELSLADRRRIATARASAAWVGNAFFEPGDEWTCDGIVVDVMFRSPRWIEDQLDRVLVRHEASVGYSTCFWHNVLHSQALVDASGFYARLQERARAPYPEPLRAAVVAKNHPLLRDHVSSFARQLVRAATRSDTVSVNHRAAALLASYFDVLFALNRLPHPGEKRLVAFAEDRCAVKPPALRESIASFLAATPQGSAAELERAIDSLVDPLDALLSEAGLLARSA